MMPKFMLITEPDSDVLRDISELSQLCSIPDLTADFEPSDALVTAYIENKLVGAIYCFNFSDDIPELSGCVHPDYRRQHIFTEMFKKLSIDKCIFSGRDSYEAFAATAISLGCTDSFHEYMLQHTQNTYEVCNISDNNELQEVNGNFYLYEGNIKIGRCMIYEETNVINIYDVEINKKYRNRGYGFFLMSSVLIALSKKNKAIILQVSEQNKSALRLYSKCGFTVIDSVLYYSRLV